MTSSQFERHVMDGAGEDPTGSAPGEDEAPQQYEPTPSFVDGDKPEIRLAELPAWLQSFAATVGEPPEPEAVTRQPSPAPDEPDEQSTVENVQDASESEPVEAPTPGTGTQGSSGVGTDFISEDDLPEWLRSIAPEDKSEGVTEPASFEYSSEGERFAVPAVSRAWSMASEGRKTDDATSLFTLVATQTSQAALPSQPGRSSGSAGGIASSYGSNFPPGKRAALNLGRSDVASDQDAEEPSRFPVVPVVVAVILLLVLAGAAVGLFFL